jgi:hypothetical protein
VSLYVYLLVAPWWQWLIGAFTLLGCSYFLCHWEPMLFRVYGNISEKTKPPVDKERP